MNNKICLIAGANSETAVSIANLFKKDHHLILCWHEHSDRIVGLLAQHRADSFCGDLQHPKTCQRLMEECRSKYPHIDVIVNCIGKNSKAVEITEEIWDDVIGNNLKPAFFLSQYYWKYYYETQCCQHHSCIIHISSTAGINPAPSSPHYIAAKAGLIALSKYFAQIMAPYVRVNVIAPSYIDTTNHCSVAYDKQRKKNLMQRFASTAEIAQTVAYIANCAYINAQTIILDGGTIN